MAHNPDWQCHRCSGTGEPTEFVAAAPSLSIAIPNNPLFVGQSFYAQGVQLGGGALLTAANTMHGKITFGEF